MFTSRAAVPFVAVAALLATASGAVAGVTPVPATPAGAGEPPPRSVDEDAPFSHATGVEPRALDESAPTARLDIQVLDRAGNVPTPDQSWYVLVLNVEDMTNYTSELVDGAASVEVPPGTYSLASFVRTPEADGRMSRTLAVDPHVEVRGDTAATLDASQARRPVEVSVDRADAGLSGGLVLFSQPGPAGMTMHPWYAFDMDPAGLNYVTPTEDVPGSRLYVSSDLTRGGAVASPWSYHLIDRSEGRVPAEPSYSHRTSDLAELQSTVAAQGPRGCGLLSQNTRVPGENVGMGHAHIAVPSPGVLTSYFTPGPQDWELYMDYTGPECELGSTDGGFSAVSRPFPEARRYTESWGAAPRGPALAGHDTSAGGDYDWWAYARREADQLVFDIPMLVDSGPGHYGQNSAWFPYAGTTGSTTLSRDGQEVGRTDLPGLGDFAVGPERASYRLDTELHRSVGWSDLSTQQQVSWTFSTGHDKGDAPDPLPLLAVRYDMDLDKWGRAPAGRPYEFGVRVESWPTAPVGAVEELTLQASYNDGRTWRDVPLAAAGEGWTASLEHPPGAGYVSLRAHAADSAGNAVDQTVIRAYGLVR